MHTQIHPSKKLEKTIQPLIQKGSVPSENFFGKWNATIFYVNRKKCWLVTNAKTQYNVLMTDIKAADLKNIEPIFKNAFFSQLVYDGIIVPFETLDQHICTLCFLSTDNDRKTTGFQNYRLADMEYWKAYYGSLENMPISDLNNRMNNIYIHLTKSRSWKDSALPKDLMRELVLG
ncbi:MAG: hypothetical protein H0X63_09965 [Flavobacteriales bacterium]|nr:hypothetical protein [Flavobacteriales bacterium]